LQGIAEVVGSNPTQSISFYEETMALNLDCFEWLSYKKPSNANAMFHNLSAYFVFFILPIFEKVKELGTARSIEGYV